MKKFFAMALAAVMSAGIGLGAGNAVQIQGGMGNRLAEVDMGRIVTMENPQVTRNEMTQNAAKGAFGAGYGVSVTGVGKSSAIMEKPTATVFSTENIDAVSHKKVQKRSDEEELWSAWEDYGTFTFPEAFVDRSNSEIKARIENAPEWDGNCTVLRRIYKSDRNIWQLKFSGLFGNGQYIVENNLSTTRLETPWEEVCRYYDDEGNDIALVAMEPSYGNFFEASGIFEFGNINVIIYNLESSYAFGSGAIYKTMNGYSEQTVKFASERMVFPSTVAKPTIDVTRSPGVSYFRVVKIPLSYYQIWFNPYYVAEPDHSEIQYDYTDYSANSFELDIENDVHTTLYVFPLNADKVATARPVQIEIDHNVAPEGEWQSLGKGTLRDYISYWGLDVWDQYFDENGHFRGEAVERQVDVEYSIDNPSVYRVRNAFGSGHPFHSDFAEPYTLGDDTYLVFDATDPSRVVMPAQINSFGMFGSFMIYSYPWIQQKSDYTVDERAYGKLVDRCITMPLNSITGFYGLGDYSVELELPGYEKFMMKWANGGYIDYTGNGISPEVANVTSNIVSIDYALVSETNIKQYEYYPEKLTELFESKTDLLVTPVKSVSGQAAGEWRLSFAENEIPYGNHCVVAAAKDAAGKYHTPIVSSRFCKLLPLDQWTALGAGRLREYTILAAASNGYETEFTVDVYENPSVPGLYYIPDIWEKWAQTTGFSSQYDASVADKLFINATDPENVFVTVYQDGSLLDQTRYEINTGLKFFYQMDVVTLTNNYENYLNGGTRTVSEQGNVYIDLAYRLQVYVYNEDGVTRVGPITGRSFNLEIGYDRAKDKDYPANWTSLGNAKVEENILVCHHDKSVVSFETEIREHPRCPGLYCLVNPYREWNKVSTYRIASDDGEDHFLIINAANPSYIHFCYSADGSLEVPGTGSNAAMWKSGLYDETNGNYNLFFVANALDYLSSGSEMSRDDYIGYMEGSELVLDNCAVAITDGGKLKSPENPRFRVMLPESGIDGVEADGSDAPVEYFNLQGMRVENPAPGIYIRRQGTAVSKVVVK